MLILIPPCLAFCMLVPTQVFFYAVVTDGGGGVFFNKAAEIIFYRVYNGYSSALIAVSVSDG